jgi:hypothetical protein
MTDISQHLPEQSKTVEAIYVEYKRRGDTEQPRSYLGASIIGHNCERYLWYTFRFCCRPEFSGRMYRLFSTGDYEELRFVNDLRSIGCEVHDADSDGNQFAVEALGGHFSGHLDGYALGVLEAPKTWHVLEFKTHNDKSFKKLVKEGVKKSKPQHYAQCVVYMGLTEMTRALYLAVNKDTDELYSERIQFDNIEFNTLMARAERIITGNSPPERISTRQDYYECSFCDARQICWGDSKSALPIPGVSCRQCCHATPTMDGKACWKCEKHKRGLSPADQSKTCDDHLVLPGLIGFARADSYGDDCITFVEDNGDVLKSWRHGKGGFSTKELMQLSPEQLTNPTILKVKEVFDATVEKVW